jgi:hypothetical protein
MTDIRTRLTDLLSTPDGQSNPLAPAASDLLETLVHFQQHTDRLCGIREPSTNDELQLPTLEKALAVGASLSGLHKMIDSQPDNSPQLALFSSFFTGKSKIDRLKSILSGDDSSISAADLEAISDGLISTMENDVKNYTVGLKKLKRLSVASIAYNSKGKQVEGELIDMFATDFTKNLLDNDESNNPTELPAGRPGSNTGSTVPDIYPPEAFDLTPATTNEEANALRFSDVVIPKASNLHYGRFVQHGVAGQLKIIIPPNGVFRKVSIRGIANQRYGAAEHLWDNARQEMTIWVLDSQGNMVIPPTKFGAVWVSAELERGSGIYTMHWNVFEFTGGYIWQFNYLRNPGR